MRRITIWTILISFLLSTGYANDAEARRRRTRKHRTKRAKIINEKKLYERIGGAKGLTVIVDEWMRLNLADQKIAPFFAKLTAKPERLGKMRRQLNDQLCELADGPCVYKSGEIDKDQANMMNGEETFLIFSDNLFKSMQKFSVPEREKNEMLGRVGEMKPDVGDES